MTNNKNNEPVLKLRQIQVELEQVTVIVDK